MTVLIVDLLPVYGSNVGGDDDVGTAVVVVVEVVASYVVAATYAFVVAAVAHAAACVLLLCFWLLSAVYEGKRGEATPDTNKTKYIYENSC